MSGAFFSNYVVPILILTPSLVFLVVFKLVLSKSFDKEEP